MVVQFAKQVLEHMPPEHRRPGWQFQFNEFSGVTLVIRVPGLMAETNGYGRSYLQLSTRMDDALLCRLDKHAMVDRVRRLIMASIETMDREIIRRCVTFVPLTKNRRYL